MQDSDYPYTASTYAGKTGACEVDTSLDVVSLTGYTQIKGETNMANYMLATGPLSVCVAAEVWNTYRSVQHWYHDITSTYLFSQVIENEK